MHQNRFLLGICPRPRWRSLQRSPDPLAGFKGFYLWRGREGREEGALLFKGAEGGGKAKEGKGPTSKGGRKGLREETGRGEGKGRGLAPPEKISGAATGSQ